MANLCQIETGWRKAKGLALIIVLIILSVMSLMVMSMLSVSLMEVKMAVATKEVLRCAHC